MADQFIEQPWLDTYATLTAESILAYANVHLSRQDLARQLAARDSFYASLVRIPARVALNSLLNTQCRDMQTYSQERLIEYILSGAESKMTTEADNALKDKIEAERLNLIQMGADLTELEKSHYQFMLDVYVLQEKQVSQWNTEVEQHSERLWKDIEQCKSDISPEWKVRLLEYMQTQAAKVTLSLQDLKNLKIKEEPVSIEKAAIQLFTDIGGNICPNVLETSKNIEAEMAELQQGLIQEREPFQVQVDQIKHSLLEKNQQLGNLRQVINDLLLQVDQNANAFKPSEDTLNNNLNMNNLDELGVASKQPEKTAAQ